MKNIENEPILFSLKFRLFENALLLCQEYFQTNQTAELLGLYTRVYLESGSPNQAVTLCQNYSQLIWKEQETSYLYAKALFESGKYEESERVFHKILEVFDDLNSEYKSSISYMIGIIMTRTHRHEQSGTQFKAAYTSQPSLVSALSYIDKIEMKEETKNPAQTRQLLTPTMLRARKTSVSKQMPISKITKIIKSPDKVEELLKELPKEFIEIPFVQKSIAFYYFKCSKYHESSHVFRKLYENHPYIVDGIDIYSTVLWQLKDEKALANLVRVSTSLAPNRPEPWIAAGNLFSLQRNSEDALKMFQRAASVDKSCSYAFSLMGHEMLLVESLADASKQFRMSIDRNPKEWSSWYGLGSVYFKQDNFKAAEYYMKKALDLNPHSSVLYYVYAMVLRKVENREKALQMFNKAIELDPANLIPVFQKGVMLRDMNENVEAIKCFDESESLSPHEPSISFEKASILLSNKDHRQALQLYTDALIYGYPDKKSIHNKIEGLIDKAVSEILKD